MSDGADQSPVLDDILVLASDIVTAYVSNNKVEQDNLPEVITTVYNALRGLDEPADLSEPASKPAVPIKKSYTNDYIICLEDGKKLKMLKRYLRSRYGLSPEEYRAKWGLPTDYPMVAPNYAKKRSEFAKQIGLGKKRS